MLGAILYDQRHVSALTPKLTAESFYSSTHGVVFSAILEVRASGTDVTVPTVEALIRSRGRLKQMPDGGMFLQQLVDDTPALTDSSFQHHVAIVLDKATLRSVTQLLHESLASAYDPATADVGAMLADIERRVLALTLGRHDIGGLRPIREALKAELTEWHERFEGRGHPGVPTGFGCYDQLTGGLHGGDFVVVAARPGMGKTSFITGLCTNVAKRGEAAAVFSLEMPARQLAARMLCTEARIALSRTRAGRLEPNELSRVTQSISGLAALGLYVDDASRGRPYVADIVARSRRLAADLKRANKRLAVVVVDYMQIVKLRDVLVKQRHELAIGEVSIELKALAKELDCTVIGVAQLNRGVESRPDKRPGMSDIRDSGQLEQDADVIAMLYRDEYYNPKTQDPGVVEILIEKNRSGPTGTLRMRFDGPTTRFEDIEAGGYNG